MLTKIGPTIFLYQKVEVHIGFQKATLCNEGSVEKRLMVKSLCLKGDKFL